MMKNGRNKMNRELGIARHTLRTFTACLLGFLTIGLTTAVAFPDSANTATLTLNGSAETATAPQGQPVLWLTHPLSWQGGSAFTANSVVFNPDYRFNTYFQFKMVGSGGTGAADGMAFVLQTESATALGADGGYLGYSGITPSVAVEFDTYLNSWDIN